MNMYIHVYVPATDIGWNRLSAPLPVPLASWMDARSEQITTQVASSVCTSQNAERADVFQEWGALENSRYMQDSIIAD